MLQLACFIYFCDFGVSCGFFLRPDLRNSSLLHLFFGSQLLNGEQKIKPHPSGLFPDNFLRRTAKFFPVGILWLWLCILGKLDLDRAASPCLGFILTMFHVLLPNLPE